MISLRKTYSVTPAEAGVQQWRQNPLLSLNWIPAFAGMTVVGREWYQ